MASYELRYKVAGERGLIDIKSYEVLNEEGALEYAHGSPRKVEQFSDGAEWVITELPTEATFCGVTLEDAWYNLQYKTAGQRETIGVDTHGVAEDGAFRFQRPDGRSGRLDPNAEWKVTDRDGARKELREERRDIALEEAKANSRLPSDWDERREHAYASDAYTCRYCGVKGGERGDAELHAHHLIPKEYGGVHSLHNLITLCRECHHAAHGRRVAPDVE